jgi:hypothetical protein
MDLERAEYEAHKATSPSAGATLGDLADFGKGRKHRREDAYSGEEEDED